MHPWKSRGDSQTIVWSTCAAPVAETGESLAVEKTPRTVASPPRLSAKRRPGTESAECPWRRSGGGRTATTTGRRPWTTTGTVDDHVRARGELAILRIPAGGS